MCARLELDLRVPRRVHALLRAAFRAAMAAEGRWLGLGAVRVRGRAPDALTWELGVS